MYVGYRKQLLCLVYQSRLASTPSPTATSSHTTVPSQSQSNCSASRAHDLEGRVLGNTHAGIGVDGDSSSDSVSLAVGLAGIYIDYFAIISRDFMASKDL